MIKIYSEKKLFKGAKFKKLPKAKKIVLIAPHSDDVSVCLGGTVSKLAESNKIMPVLFFSGYRGVEKRKTEAIELREKEMKKESRILSIKEPVFLRLSCYNKDNYILREEDIFEVELFLKKHNPDIIFLPKKDDLHKRHKLAALITLKALKSPFFKKKRILFFYESPWSLFQAFEFNAVFPFSNKEMKKKMKAVKVHSSQLKRTRLDKAAFSLAVFRGCATAEQRIFGYGKKGFSFPFLEVFYEDTC